eukprot:s1939_g18.t1
MMTQRADVHIAPSSSMPNLLPAGASRLPAGARWVAARGSGQFHFLNADHVIHDKQHEASQQAMWNQRRSLQEENRQRSSRLLDHFSDDLSQTTQEKLLAVRSATYDINGKVFAAGKQPTAPPKQSDRGHWLTQVNGLTNRYNIINGMSINPSIARHRDAELQRLSQTLSGLPAGNVQPLRDVACYDIPGFVPIRQRHLPGEVERTYTLNS